MGIKIKGIIKGTEGTTAVEFAIIAMVFFMLILGIIEFGLLLYNNTMLTHTSRVAARTGVVYSFYEDASGDLFSHLDDPNIRAAAETFWKDRFITFGDRSTAFNLTIERFTAGDYTPVAYGTESSNDLLEVALTYDYEFLFLKIFGLGPITLRARTSMRFE